MESDLIRITRLSLLMVATLILAQSDASHAAQNAISAVIVWVPLLDVYTAIRADRLGYAGSFSQ